MSSGTQAAAHGGYTTVCAMPNLDPVPDSLPHLEQQLALIRRDAAIRVLPYGSITRGQLGEELSDMAAHGPYVWRPSPTTGEVCRARRRCALPWKPPRGFISSSWPTASDNSPPRGLHPRRGLRPHPRPPGHLLRKRVGADPAGSGTGAPDRLRLPRLPHLHQGERGAHPPGKGAGAGRHLRDGPHYLLMDETMLQEDGRFKMNPPLRSPADRGRPAGGAGRRHHRHGRHRSRPHSAEEKSRGLEKSAMGIVGLETAFPPADTYLVKPGLLSFPRLMELLHDAPCRRFGLPRAGWSPRRFHGL